MHRLELDFLGPPRITLDDATVDISRRKAVALLAYLAVTRQSHSRETLAALFWPDVDQSRAYAYLRTMLWTLNKALGDEWIDTERDTVTLRPGTDWQADVTQFRALADGAPVGDPARDAARLADAAALFQDDFLAGFTLADSPAFDEWQFFEQEDLRRTLARVLDDLVGCYARLGQFDTAIPYAQRRLALDTLHEPAHRQLMRLFAWAGQWSAALRQAEQCITTLDAELGVAPEPETAALIETIQARRAPDAPVVARTVSTPRPVETPGNIPAQTTPFIARERELDEIADRLDDPACRLLTLVGQGGIGKTRLALQVAALLADRFPDGAYVVPLAPVNAAEYMVPALADALQFTAARKDDPKAQLLDFLRGKRLLLVMDNFEHLLDGVDLVVELLAGAPGIKILATSRERLQLQEEWLYELHGLAYPDDEHTLIPSANQYGAVRLFVESGRRVRPDFALNADNVAAVRRICQLVEGMPLGLLLAAAWLQMLAPHEIAHEIERSLDFLESSLRSLPERHRSLRAVFESSWERLTAGEQRVLSQLAVFRGNFRREAAHIVAGATLPVLRSLVSKSLLYRDADDRYTMHERLRQFAEEKLDADPVQREATFDAYTRYYAAFVREREPLLKGGAQIKALNEIEADIDNIRLAWMLAIGRRDPAVIRGLLVGLSMFYFMRSRQHESREMFSGTAQYLAALDDLSEDEQVFLAQIKVNQALAIRMLDERYTPLVLYQEALPVLAELDGADAVMPLVMLAELGIWPAHDFVTTEKLARKVLAFDDAWGRGRALHILGDLAHHQIDYDTSQRLYQQSLAISRATGDRWSEGTDLNMLGEVAYTLGDYAGAEQLYRESMALSEAVGDRNNRAWCMDRLSDVIALQGRYAEARVIALEGIDLGYEMGSRARIAYGLLALVEIAASEQDYDEALRRFEQTQEAFAEVDPGDGQAWLAISRCQIALALENAGDLEWFARSALAMFEAAGSPFGVDAAGSPWGRSAALHYLGEAARMNGDYDAARDYLRRAVRLADDSRSIMLLTRYLIGFAALFADTGEPERAVELLTFVVRHRATWAVSRTRAAHLLDDLAALLPAEAFAAAQARGAALTASAVVAALLP